MTQLTRRQAIQTLGTSAAFLLAGRTLSWAADGKADDKPLVFLLVGQSNMAGRGKVEASDPKPHPRVFKLSKEDKWVPATDPLHFDKPNVAGVGPGSGFGPAIAEAFPNKTIHLVPSAVGGTSIDQWKRGDKLNNEAIRRAKLALETGTLAGILWHQGEADSSPEKIEAYPAKAATLFAGFREDLKSPDAPIVAGWLGEFLGERAEKFNAMLGKLPEKIARMAVVDSKGLKDKGDKLHFDAPSAREFGKRYATAMVKLMEAVKKK